MSVVRDVRDPPEKTGALVAREWPTKDGFQVQSSESDGNWECHRGVTPIAVAPRLMDRLREGLCSR